MPFTDDFTGTNGDALDARTGWTRVDGAANNAQINAANQLKATSATNTAYTCIDQADADHYTQSTWEAVSRASFVCVRLTNANNFIGVRPSGSPAKTQIYKRDTGSFTQLGPNGATTVVATDVEYIEGSGNNITAKLNGSTEVGPITETFSNTVTTQGLVVRESWNPLIDDFEAGVLAAGGATIPVLMQKNNVGFDLYNGTLI